MKMNLLAMACTCPGVVSLIANLISSDSTQTSQDKPLWMQNYTDGKQFELYRTNLSESLRELPFTTVARLVYEETAAVR
jgi:hypothetical protein